MVDHAIGDDIAEVAEQRMTDMQVGLSDQSACVIEILPPYADRP